MFLQIKRKEAMNFIRFFLICIFIEFSLLSHSSPLSHSESLINSSAPVEGVSEASVEGGSEASVEEGFEVSVGKDSEVSVEGGSEKSLTYSSTEKITLPEDLLDNAQKSVWKISNSLSSGSAFSISPNLFVTNFHVMAYMLKGDDSIGNIVLEQKFSTSQLRVKRIVSISFLYDLVLFETEGVVANYLSIAEDLLQPEDELFIFGYPEMEFQGLRKTGEFIGDKDLHAFPVNNSYLHGSSGSPVLDEQGQLVGIATQAAVNILFMRQVNDLKELITGNTGLSCFDFVDLSMCVEAEVKHLKNLADQGHALAQYRLATLYREGLGVAQDNKKAFDWYKKSADQGYVPAQNNIATMYFRGEGVAQDGKKAFDWYKKSADQSSSMAQYTLAAMYRDGMVVAQDYGMAFHWYKRSAEQGYAPSQYNMAAMYRDGIGVAQDYEQALYWFQKSADQGDASAQHGLGNMYFRGLGVAQDYEKAFDWSEKAADQGDALAQYDVAIMYREGVGVAQDNKMALYWFQRSAFQGYAPARKFLMAILPKTQ